MKSVIVAFACAFVAGMNQAQALSLHYVGETSIPTGTKFQDTTIGGLSGMIWQGSSLFALSDDKGKDGEPRFYSFDLKIDKNVNLTPKNVTFIKGLPPENQRKPFIDPEGLVRLADGDFLISSEANTDAKPRTMPRIFRVSADGQWKSDFVIPDKYLPEPLGQQTKGVQNNQSFEGLTGWDNGKYVFAGMESPLVQDIPLGDEARGEVIRILKFEDRGAQRGYYTATSEYAYRVDPMSDRQKGKEVFKGVSEILALSETKLLVLERGVRITKNSMASTVSVFLADLSKATNTLGMQKLSESDVTMAKKVKLIDFETDLVKERGDKKVQNFEALSWGPTLPDGRRSLLVMADNNFSKRELTELLVFAVEGE